MASAVELPPEPLLEGTEKTILPLKLLFESSTNLIFPVASGEPECPKPNFNIASLAVPVALVELLINNVVEVPPSTSKFALGLVVPIPTLPS
jgi:hypothetical protein